MIGDRRTRKTDVVERLFRQELTEEAMKKMEKKQLLLMAKIWKWKTKMKMKKVKKMKKRMKRMKKMMV